MKPTLLDLLAAARQAGIFVMASIAGVPNLLQLVRDNAQRSASIRAEESGDATHVYVYGVIGGFWGDVSAQMFATTLAGIKAATVHLHVQSPGGDVFEARAMMSAIANHPATFIGHVDGLAASAASDLIMACDEIEISQGGFLMIHNAWTIAMGNKSDLRTTADLLEKVDGAIVDDYQKRTKKSTEQVREWMDAETWFTADEAKTHGFVDRIVEVVPAEDDADDGDAAPAENRWDLAAYQHAPAALKVSREKPATLKSGLPANSAVPNLNETERSFCAEMIEHHRLALDMVDGVYKNLEAVEIKSLANGIITAQTGEIALLQRWIGEADDNAAAKKKQPMKKMDATDQASLAAVRAGLDRRLRLLERTGA